VCGLIALTACSFRDYESLYDGAADRDAASADAAVAEDASGSDGASEPTDAGEKPDPLMAWWRLDETSGATAFDSSGHGNHGAVANGVSWVPGQRAGAASFDGVTGAISVADAPSLKVARDALTVAFWVSAEDAPDDERLVRMGYVWEVKLNGVDRRPQLNAGTSFERFAGMSRGLPTGQWHHLAFTFDHGEVKGYFDGALASLASNSFSGTDPLASDNYGMQLGKSPENVFFCKCALDDVRVYARALDSTEIATLAR
jgi:hypothetical protein